MKEDSGDRRDTETERYASDTGSTSTSKKKGYCCAKRKVFNFDLNEVRDWEWRI